MSSLKSENKSNNDVAPIAATIPSLDSPNLSEIDRMIYSLERRVQIMGRDQRTYSGIYNLKARTFFVLGFAVSFMLVMAALYLARL